MYINTVRLEKCNSLPYDYSTDLRLRSYAPANFHGHLANCSGQCLPPILCYHPGSEELWFMWKNYLS